MNKILNQILILQKTIKKWLRGVLPLVLLLPSLFSLISAVHAANPDSITLGCRPNFGPPEAVTDLVAITGNNLGEIDISWTVPAEDPPPVYGELVLNWPYHLRYSTNSLAVFASTDAWWNQATDYIQGWSEVGNGYGYTRNQTLTFGSEYYGQTMYLGMRAEDSGHYLSLSTATNIASAVVKSDDIPPAAISDLTALAGNYEGEINLQWTSPGADGTVGNFTGQFIIKYAQEIITNSNFDVVGTTIIIPASGVVPLSAQTTGPIQLTEGVTYWFAIKAEDSVGALSVWNSSADVSSVNTNAYAVAAVDDDVPVAPALSIGSAGFTDVELKWNAQTENIGRTTSPMDDLTDGYYDIRFSSLGAIPANVAWNSIPIYNRRMVSTSTVIGEAESYNVTGLSDHTTWWFCVVAIDDAGLSSTWSNSPFALTSDETPPAPVSNFAATPLYVPNGREIQLTWTNPTDDDFRGVVIVYSSGSISDFTPAAGANYSVGDYNGCILSTGPATSYIHSGLVPQVEYFYTAYAYDMRPNYSSAVSTAAIAPPSLDTIAPNEPRNVKALMLSDGNWITISWCKVEKSTDGTKATDLSHYTLYRSTSIGGTWTAWSIDKNVTSTTTYTGGEVYYYWLTAHDFSSNVSEPSAVVSSNGEVIFFDPSDPKTRITIPDAKDSILYKENNSYGEDVFFDIVRLKIEETGKVYKSFTFIPKGVDSDSVIVGFVFSRAIMNIQISYSVDSNGYIKSSPAMAPIKADKAPNSLALFWFNGVEWIKVGGDVDTAEQTVSIRTKKGGQYQLRQSMKSAKFTLNNIYPRIFTPNDDGWNDVVNFVYEGNDDGITGKIFDINGAFVADMARGDTIYSLKWNGKNSSNEAVSSGIYIYQIEADGRVINGTIVVAK